MILIVGIHGVGKTTIGRKLESDLGVQCYTASRLIEVGSKHKMFQNKKVFNIRRNQEILIKEIQRKNRKEKRFILEGHICLLDKNNKVNVISSAVFKKLNPEMIIVIVDSEKIIAKRNKYKSEKLASEEFLISFQREEIRNAKKIGKIMKIPVLIVNNDIEGYEFLRRYMEG